MVEEAQDIYDQLQDMCWDKKIFRYMEDEINNFSMEWFIKNEQKVYEWWNKVYDTFSSDVKNVWDSAEEAAREELGEEYDDDEITDEMVMNRAEDMAQMFYDDIGKEWEDLIKLVDNFRDDQELLWKIGKLEDDIDECYKIVDNEMSDLIKEKIREIFED